MTVNIPGSPAAGLATGSAVVNLTSNPSGTVLPAQTITVNGGVFNGNATWVTGGTSSWASAGNWVDANGIHAAPGTFAGFGNTDTANFTAAGNPSVTLDTAAPSLKAIAFNSTGSSYTLTQGSGSNSLTLDNGLSNATIIDSGNGSSHVINVPVILKSNLAVTVTNAGEMVSITGNISESGSSKSVTFTGGSGELVLGGTNNYSGGTFVNGPGITFTSDASLGTGGVTLNTGALLANATVPSFTLSHLLTVNGTGNTLGVAAGKIVTVNSSKLTGSGAVAIGSLANTGLLVLNNDNASAIAFTGAVNINGGALGGNAAIGSAITLTSGTITGGNSIGQDPASANQSGGVGALTVASLILKGGTYVWKVTSSGQLTSPSAGNGYDTIVASSLIDLTNLTGTAPFKTALAIGNQGALETAVNSLGTAHVASNYLLASAPNVATPGHADTTSALDVSICLI